MSDKGKPKSPPFKDAKEFLKRQYKEEAFEDAEGVQISSTGSLSLDWVLGGGLAGGRIYELYGTEGSGKTTAALTAARSVQRLGRPVFYIDFEHALDTEYARDVVGVSLDPARWLLVQPNTAEAGLDMALEVLEKFDAGLVIVDSVAAMVPRAEVEGAVGDLQVGAQARVMGKAMRKLTGVAHRHSAAVIFINQVRDKIGGFGFGDPTVTPGGKALKFFASVRTQMKKIKTLDDGVVIQIQIKKSKITSSQKRKASFTIRSGMGIDLADEVITLGVACGVIEKPNSQTHKFPQISKPIPKGEATARKFLRKPKNKFYLDLLLEKILKAMLEQERSKLEFLPQDDDRDPLLDIAYDGDSKKLGSLDEMPESDWVSKRPKSSATDSDSEAEEPAIDTEEVVEEAEEEAMATAEAEDES
jgi:recombination protein RecA